MPYKDPEAQRAQRRRNYLANRDVRIAQANARQTAAREADPEGFRAYRAQKKREYHDRLRQKIFAHYGEQCACCGSDDRPTIDHKAGDGGDHRMKMFGRRTGNSGGTYRWLIRNGFPEGFQTLCSPCNNSKQNGPACRINHGYT